MLKKIDVLIIRSFLPPLLIWTLVAMFVFNMQFLWKYIDDIIGKGLDLTIILELLLYQSLAMIPRAMVFGVLIASVMTLGNLAEHYELVSMKSAGVSLFRVMMPLLMVSMLLASVSLVFSDQLIPITALKFKSVLTDIRTQKPALSFDEGQFNNDFKDVSLFVGKKMKGGKRLQHVRIYDHTTPSGYKGQTNAQEAGLYYTRDTFHKKIKRPQKEGEKPTVKDTVVHKSFLVVELKNGSRYEELQANPDRPKAYPHMQMNFETYTKLFDMSEFEFKKTDENLFRGHYSFLSIRQLLRAIDSLYRVRKERHAMMIRNADAMFQFRREGISYHDTVDLHPHQYFKQYGIAPVVAGTPHIKVDTIPNSFPDLIPRKKVNHIYQRAAGYCQNIKGQTKGLQQYNKVSRRNHANHENEIHQKFSFALACLLFLFIGAPMGAIIRKGGFGWPILVAFLFFMAFFVFYLAGERLAKNLAMPCWLGAWLPNVVLLPFGFYLTYTALNDRRVINTDIFIQAYEKLKTYWQKVPSLNINWSFWKENRGFILSFLMLWGLGLLLLSQLSKGDAILWFSQHRSDWLNYTFRFATALAEGYVHLIAIIVFLFVQYARSLAVLLNLFLALGLSTAAKIYFGHERPIRYFTDLIRQPDVVNYVPDVILNQGWQTSFPSGHTAAAFALFSFLAFLTPNKWLKFFYLVLATMVGISRIYLVQHFLKDVVAGMLLGFLVGLLVYWLYLKLTERLGGRIQWNSKK